MMQLSTFLVVCVSRQAYSGDFSTGLRIHAVLNQTFNDASKLLYRDQSVHLLDGPKAVPEIPDTLESDDDDSSTVSSDSTTDAEISSEDFGEVSRPRREIIWVSLTDDTITLKDVSRQYKDILESFPFSPFYLEPEMRTAGVYRLVHRCQGYRREEVTFKPAISDCKVVMYVTPALHEKCVVCGRDVEVFRCICGRRMSLASLSMDILITRASADDGFSPTVKCVKCHLVWVHSRCRSNICWVCVSSDVVERVQLGQRRELGLVELWQQERWQWQLERVLERVRRELERVRRELGLVQLGLPEAGAAAAVAAEAGGAGGAGAVAVAAGAGAVGAAAGVAGSWGWRKLGQRQERQEELQWQL
ncbi:uncharacterized protein EV420DRAFT_82304 [Desarmillaria tabescens]|uniref:Uncharacterized protein n=1 Tax=Armillaria tabescens TaxID=1929756 RepID=A0AA39NQH8_ARMTA|nr:uncharacterized protein EV420DRAFT_82304 [Desarmillaria tabescens]KAK0469966.1 hypothetical protein EV420DRAFT_82304 [Desarmillaria tabescens]